VSTPTTTTATTTTTTTSPAPSPAGAAAILLVDAGDLAALAAASVESDPAEVVVWHPQVEAAGAAGRRRAAEAHAEMLGGARLLLGRPRPAPGSAAGGPGGASAAGEIEVRRGLHEAAILLEAVERAVDLGCRRVVWPVAVGGDAARILAVGERAECVMDLVRGGHGSEPATGAGAATAGVRLEAIDLPLVDLEDDELADLAADAGVPLDAFWPCDGDGAVAGGDPCGRCPGCRRWQAAFGRRGLSWPWRVAEDVPSVGGPLIETVGRADGSRRPAPGRRGTGPRRSG